MTSGTAHDSSGAKFVIVGVSNTPTDWAQVFRSIVNSDLTIDAMTVRGSTVTPAAATVAAAPEEQHGEPMPDGGDGQDRTSGPRAMSTTPPRVLNLNAYLMYALGKAARRRLSERLTAYGLRLWHLTVLALLADLGPQSKVALASRLDMNQSDLVKIVNDLDKAGRVHCARDPSDRRRVMVTLTPEGRAALAHLSADIASTDDDLLAPLSPAERIQLASLLRRVHGHVDPTPAGVIHKGAGVPAHDAADASHKRSIEDSRIDWNQPAEHIERLVRTRSHTYPSAYTHHNGRRLELLAATVSAGRYAGIPGGLVHTEDDGVVVVTGAEAPTGRNGGLVVSRVRTEDGLEMSAADYFRSTAGLVTLHN
ncbi:winged helix DNA-binding protein [Streptomyces sp. NPDC003042]